MARRQYLQGGASMALAKHCYIPAGVDVVTISKRPGHANVKTTLDTYAHLFNKRDDKSRDAINAAPAGFGEA